VPPPFGSFFLIQTANVIEYLFDVLQIKIRNLFVLLNLNFKTPCRLFRLHGFIKTVSVMFYSAAWAIIFRLSAGMSQFGPPEFDLRHLSIHHGVTINAILLT
jgi:hypothetical protein